MTRKAMVGLALRMHGRILAVLGRIRRSKVEVYLLLRELKRKKLYRFVERPAGDDVMEICAGRRFVTWEDYLEGLGDAGISFGYFAELERLEEKFGEGMVFLCAAGLPVVERRMLLRMENMFDHERVRAIVDADAPAKVRIEEVKRYVGRWMEEGMGKGVRFKSGWAMAGVAWRGMKHHQLVMASIVVGGEHVDEVGWRAVKGCDEVAKGWEDCFERHLEIGERLGRLGVVPGLGMAQAEWLRRAREAWNGGEPSGDWELVSGERAA